MLNFSPRSRPRQEYGVETLTRGFWILNFELCRGEKVRMCKGSFALNVEGVAGLAGKGVREITIKVYIPLIYIVNTSLQSKY